MNKNILFISLLFIMFASSCSNEDGKNFPIYTVNYTDFENILLMEGLVEPVLSTTLVCPMNIEGTVVKLLEEGTLVEEGEVVCIIESPKLQTEYDNVKTNYENAEASLNKTKAHLNMEYALLEAQVRNNEAESMISSLDSLQLAYSTPSQQRIKELELQTVAIQKKKYEKKLQALAVIQQTEILRAETRLQRLQRRLESLQDTMDELVIKSPCKGLVVRARNRRTGLKLREGDIVWSNMPLAIIPGMEAMKVKIQAPETDFKAINTDDSVVYTFDAMPGNLAFGKITKKSPVGQALSQNSKVKFFEVEASVDSFLQLPDPDFTSNCHIILKHIPDTLIVPQISVFDEDSIKVVYVKEGNGFERRQVLTGTTSPKEAIISIGLRNGEQVSMIKPKAASVRKTTLLPDSIVKQKKLVN